MECALCGSTALETLGKRSDFGDLSIYADYLADVPSLDRDLLRCRACGLSFVHPMYGPKELGDLYDQPRYYHFLETFCSVGELSSSHSRELIEGWKRQFLAVGVARWMKTRVAATTRPSFLDVGCGTGRKMTVFHELGFDVTGIDRNAAEIEFVRSRLGFRAIPTSLEEFSGSGERFDCVFASHIIEHVVDLHSFLEHVGRLMTAQGLFVLETPLCNDHGMLEQRYRDIYHTLFFDHFTLTLAGMKHGMQVVGSQNILFLAPGTASRNIFIQMAYTKGVQPPSLPSHETIGAFRSAYDALLTDGVAWSTQHLLHHASLTQQLLWRVRRAIHRDRNGSIRILARVWHAVRRLRSRGMTGLLRGARR